MNESKIWKKTMQGLLSIIMLSFVRKDIWMNLEENYWKLMKNKLWDRKTKNLQKKPKQSPTLLTLAIWLESSTSTTKTEWNESYTESPEVTH